MHVSFDCDDSGPRPLSLELSLGKSNSGLSFPVPDMLLAPLVAFKQEGDDSKSDLSIFFLSPGHMSTKGGPELFI